MAQERQNITIAAPAFRGLNTQDSPITLDASYASIADNCVIDQYGRIGSRKGLLALTTDTTLINGSDGIECIKEYINPTGDNVIFSAGNNKIFSGTTTLTDETPVSYTITSNNWKMVNFNDSLYMFQKDYEPLVYSTASGAVQKMSDVTTAVGTPPQGNEVLSAYGRLWVADFSLNNDIIYWSDLLNGSAWSGGTSGSINVSKVWPNGQDEVVAIAAHNGYLIIFGKNSILTYSGASDPSTMQLADTVANVGCVSRDTVQHTGTDLIFMSSEGLRSLGRTIQEKSMPMRDVSKNVRNDLINVNSSQVNRPLRSVFSPEEAFYLVSFSDSRYVFCFDMRTVLEDGSHRVTTWSNIDLRALERAQDGTLYVGNTNGIGKYSGYQDYNSSYDMSYFSNPLSFGDSSRLKMLKEIIMTFIGGQGAQVNINWGYDYTGSYKKQIVTIDSGSVVGYYGVSEYESDIVLRPDSNWAEYSASVIVDRPNTKTSGSGTVATIGIEATINNNALSLQEVNIQAIIGRMI
jgi:hypothetical protein